MKIIIAVVLLMPCLLWGQTRYYVRAGAAGSGNSRSDAAGDLQEVLQAAVSGDEVWGAEGGYYPTAGTDCRISFAPAGGRAARNRQGTVGMRQDISGSVRKC